MAYLLDFVTSGDVNELPGKEQITLEDRVVDTTSTSLVLFGRGAENYGEGQQEDLIRLLENFAATLPPPNPTVGQLWYNATKQEFYVYNNAQTWVPICSGLAIGPTVPDSPNPGMFWFDNTTNKLYVWDATEPGWILLNPTRLNYAYLDEYNRFVGIYNSIVGTASSSFGSGCSSAYGFGQVSRMLPYLSSMDNQNWLTLLGRISELATFMRVDQTGLSTRGFILDDAYTPVTYGLAGIVGEYARSLEILENLYGSRTSFALYGFDDLILTKINTDTSTSDWTQNIGSAGRVSMFTGVTSFNSGAYIKFVPRLTIPAGTDVSVMNSAWRRFLADSVNAVYFNACGTLDQQELDGKVSIADREHGTGLGFYGMSTDGEWNKVYEYKVSYYDFISGYLDGGAYGGAYGSIPEGAYPDGVINLRVYSRFETLGNGSNAVVGFRIELNDYTGIIIKGTTTIDTYEVHANSDFISNPSLTTPTYTVINSLVLLPPIS